MLRKRDEAHHNTPEQVEAYLAAAKRIVGEAELPEHLEAVALAETIRLLAAKQVILEEVGIAPPTMAIPRG